MLKEALEARSTYKPYVFLEELRKLTKSLSKSTRNSIRSSNFSPTDYESEQSFPDNGGRKGLRNLQVDVNC
jgi:hypothetical protein